MERNGLPTVAIGKRYGSNKLALILFPARVWWATIEGRSPLDTREPLEIKHLSQIAQTRQLKQKERLRGGVPQREGSNRMDQPSARSSKDNALDPPVLSLSLIDPRACRRMIRWEKTAPRSPGSRPRVASTGTGSLCQTSAEVLGTTGVNAASKGSDGLRPRTMDKVP